MTSLQQLATDASYAPDSLCVFTVRLPRHLWLRFRQAAHAEKVSANSLAIEWLTAAVEAIEGLQKGMEMGKAKEKETSNAG